METTNNLRKPAIVLAALGEELALQACSRLPTNQVLRLTEEIARLGWVSTEELHEALAEFSAAQVTAMRLGGTQYARNLLDSALGLAAGAAALGDGELRELAIFSQLDDLPPEALHRVLRPESRQVVAAVVCHLAPAQSGRLLAYYDDAVAADIAYRAAHLSAPSPGAVQALAATLDLELGATQPRREAGREISLQYMVDLIGALPSGRNKAVLEALSALDKPFGVSVAEQVFTFEDIVALTDANLQVLLRSVDMNLLVVALKGTAPELRERVSANLSQRGRERLAEEMEVMGPTPLSQVQEAQRQVCADARALADRGEITLDGASEQYVE